VVSAAVDTVDGLQLTIRHQFPICTSKTAFRDKVANDTDRPKINGPLGGLPREIVGVIRQLQPFNVAGRSALETIQTLSNTDKHRSLLTCSAYPVGSADWTVGPRSEIEANEVIPTDPPIPGAPVGIARIRLRKGSTQPVNVTLGTSGQVAVAAPPFNNRPGILLSIPEMPNLLNEVRQAVHQFATPV
jgi:hypothetical protein